MRSTRLRALVSARQSEIATPAPVNGAAFIWQPPVVTARSVRALPRAHVPRTSSLGRSTELAGMDGHDGMAPGERTRILNQFWTWPAGGSMTPRLAVHSLVNFVYGGPAVLTFGTKLGSPGTMPLVFVAPRA